MSRIIQYCLLIIVVSISGSLSQAPSNACINPEGRDGVCINIRRCDSLLKLVKHRPRTSEDVTFLQASQCGSEGYLQPKVCCTDGFEPRNDSTTAVPEVTNDPHEHYSTARLTIAAGAIVHQGSFLRGDITIGAGTVVSPQARIIADSGSIVIGQGNVIEAGASIINRAGGGSSDAGQTQIIGNGNVFKSGSTCEALSVGGGNIFQPGAYVRRGTIVGDGQIIS